MAAYTVTDGQTQNLSLTNFNRQPQNDTIDVSGNATLNLNIPGGSNEQVAVNLAPNTTLTGNFNFVSLQALKFMGDTSAKLILTGTNSFGAPNPALFGVDVSGPATINVGRSGIVEFARGVSGDVSLNLGPDSGVTLGQPTAFKGAIYLDDSTIHLNGLDAATDYDLSNGILSIYGGADDALLDTLRLSGDSSTFAVTHNGSQVNVVETGGAATAAAGTTLAQHVTPPNPQPPTTQNVVAHDNTTGADLPDTSSSYTGPVAGIASQFMNITPDNLNIAAKADSLFIKTGAGNDAIALHGGTNVADAGGGSNFLTGAGGFDTFFLDARNIPAASSAAGPVPGAIWDTIQEFGAGDAATLFGVGPGAAFSWQRDGGAAGHTGLTLHATKQNGSTASLTLAGIDNGSHLQLSFGSTGGASYLYVKAT